MLYQLTSYISFLLKSTNHHGLHSPFVYDLTTKCFNDKSEIEDFKILKDYRQELVNHQLKIKITDFGAGSKNLKNELRSISSIAKNAGISKKRVQLLYRISNYFKFENVLEIGTSLGIATAGLALANRQTMITTLEGCPETAKIAHQQFNKFNLKNIKLITGEFNTTLPNALENNTFDLIFFDGNHQKKPTINYFEQCLEHCHNDSVFIFDDIYWSKGMNKAWIYIKNHPKVTVSIDTFQWGLLFFRKEQEKQHFTLRV